MTELAPIGEALWLSIRKFISDNDKGRVAELIASLMEEQGATNLPDDAPYLCQAADGSEVGGDFFIHPGLVHGKLHLTEEYYQRIIVPKFDRPHRYVLVKCGRVALRDGNYIVQLHDPDSKKFYHTQVVPASAVEDVRLSHFREPHEMAEEKKTRSLLNIWNKKRTV